MEEQKDQNGFYAIVSLLGHTTLSGYLDEFTMGGSSFLRITVPETTRQPKWQRLFTSSSVYSIDPVTEEVAKYKAESLNVAPIETWSARTMITKLLQNEGKLIAPIDPNKDLEDRYVSPNEEDLNGVF